MKEGSINIFIIQLAFVFLPGMLWARMNRAFVSKKEIGTTDFFINSFFNGLIVYLTVFFIFYFLKWPFQILSIPEADAKMVITPQVAKEVAFALAIAPIFGVIDMYLSNGRVLVSFLQWIKATKRFGYEDIWDYTFNTNTAQAEYVYVRDFDKQLVFAGWVRAFSESEKARELLLRDVRVTDFDGKVLYEVPLMYLAAPADTFHIEFPVPNGGVNGKATTDGI